MSHLYKHILLIRPDVFEKAHNAVMSWKVSSNSGSNTALSHPLPPPPPKKEDKSDDQQTALIRREMIKDSFSPVASMVEVLAHL